MDPQGKIHDSLAKSWKVTATTATFQLKQGATCSDGTTVTPTVVKNSFQLFIDRKAPYLSVWFGPGPYSVAADDGAGTFTFTSGTPFSDLVYGFISPMFGVICPAGLAAYQADHNAFQNKMYGSGPYNMTEAVRGDHFTFKIRPEFSWGPMGTTAKTVGVPDTVTVKVVTNDTTAANLLLTGGLDVAAGSANGAINGPDVDRLTKESSLTHTEQFNWYLRMLVFNETPGHVGTDPVVRQALITAVDPKAWLQAADNGHARLSPTFITTDTQCFDANVAKLAPKPSVATARKVLTDAGWTYANGKLTKNGQPLKVDFTTAIQFAAGPEYIAKQWSDMGADVQLNNLDFASYSNVAVSGKFDAFIINTSTPGPFMGPVSKRIAGTLPPAGTNFARTVDPVLADEQAAALTSTGAESCKHWSNFQAQLWKNWHLMGLSSPLVENFTKNVDLSLGISPLMVRRVR
jgi:peptide/nickel transport system substrate-binding protein